MLVDNEIQSKCNDLQEKRAKYYKNYWPAVILGLISASAFIASLSIASNATIEQPEYFAGVGALVIIGVAIAVYANRYWQKSKKFKLKMTEENAILSNKFIFTLKKTKTNLLRS